MWSVPKLLDSTAATIVQVVAQNINDFGLQDMILLCFDAVAWNIGTKFVSVWKKRLADSYSVWLVVTTSPVGSVTQKATAHSNFDVLAQNSKNVVILGVQYVFRTGPTTGHDVFGSSKFHAFEKLIEKILIESGLLNLIEHV